MSSDAARTPDSAEYRRVFGHLPTGVVVVTGCGPAGEALGITVGSFGSISLDPPLAGFFVGTSSRSWPLIAARGAFSANVLAATQGELCWRFAKEQADGSRFDGLAFASTPNGSPLLPGVVAAIDCTVHSVHEVGDHRLVVGAVTHLQVHDASAAPMVFVKGKIGDAAPAP